MKRVATRESIGSSNRIEGNRMTDAQVEAFFNHIDRKSFRSRDEEEVAGYADLINTIFETATPFDTPRLMAELIDWTNRTLQDQYLHPIITIGIFIVHFLAIHPFADGNGRMSRALTAYLLLRQGYQYAPYASMESIVEGSKEAYYRALRGTQQHIWSGRVDDEPWLSFFITSLQKQKLMLEAKLKTLHQVHEDSLSELALRILSIFSANTMLEMSAIISAVGGNAETIRKNVQTLVRKGYLRKWGTTKGARYSRQ